MTIFPDPLASTNHGMAPVETTTEAGDLAITDIPGLASALDQPRTEHARPNPHRRRFSASAKIERPVLESPLTPRGKME
ncbi:MULTISPECIES: hypothetical protein [Mesorhizobium]|uniref:hypothetical protein n=1 Tax=Mesorhizobium TaxID=68287 RepID=UPI0012DB4C70|nr:MULTISPECIES: hypothetical protein [Mesorhizobium]